MAVEVFMPKAGMDMKEGKIIKWLVNVGDEVKEGDGVLEIETDKVTMEVEAPADGTLLCKYFEDGTTVPVVTIIGYIGEKGEKVPDGPATAGAEETKAPESTSEATKKPEKNDNSYDVAVIGGGPAGYVAAIRAAQLGGKVVIFEKDVVGGTCLNRGCIPTKTYIKTAETIHGIKEAHLRGVHVDTNSLSVNMEEIYNYKNTVVKKLTSGVGALLKSNGVEIVNGTATIADKNTVECNGKKYTSQNIILCGGSVAGRIPLEGIEGKKVLDSTDILELKEIPAKLGVIGGGVIGCEIATAFNTFGSEVTIVELADNLVSMFDKEVSTSIEKSMKKAGVKVLTGKNIKKIENSDEKPCIVLESGEKFEFDNVLLSIGRKADIECVGSLKDTLKLERGKIVVDEYCKTNIDNIYACGDITTKSTLAHSAFKMGEVAANNAMGHTEKCNLNNVPGCLYTMPEAASVGLTEEAAKKDHDIAVGKFPFGANGRALSSGESEGFVKVIIDKKYGEILGVHIVGAVATEMIMEAKAAMDAELTVYEISEMIHPHPTYTEAFVEACTDALGRCIHLPKK